MNKDYIKKLIRILENSQIDSIQLSSFWGMNKIKLFKTSQRTTVVEPINSPLTSSHVNNISANQPIIDQQEEVKESSNSIDKENLVVESTDPSNLHSIKAPLVGTFYLSPKPGEPAFINVGDKIKVGQIICIIEAMKIFNEIESEVSGTVEKILIDDSNPVEYGQAIILVKIDD